MNILYICEEYPPGKNGGIGTMVQVLGRELVSQGHNVYVVGLYPLGYSQKNYEEDNGVKIWRLRYNTDIGIFKGSYSLLDKVFLKFYLFSGLKYIDTISSTKKLFNFINELITEYNIDIIEIPDWNTFLHNSLRSIQIPSFNVPLIVKLNGSHTYFSHELNEPIISGIFKSEAHLLKRADAIASASVYTAQETKKLFNLSKEITVLYNSVNIPAYVQKNNSNNNIIFTGALIKKKGIFSLLKAWNLVHEKRPEVFLDIYGKGPMIKFKKILTTKSLHSVRFHEHTKREVILEELSKAKMAIFPSYSECFSFAPLEAMSVGCPIIYSSRSSGIELIENNVNGLLIDPDNINVIAESIIKLLDNINLRNQIAEEGRMTVSNKFNIVYSAKDHISFYQTTIKNFVN
jgi:glycogen synthase